MTVAYRDPPLELKGERTVDCYGNRPCCLSSPQRFRRAALHTDRPLTNMSTELGVTQAGGIYWDPMVDQILGDVYWDLKHLGNLPYDTFSLLGTKFFHLRLFRFPGWELSVPIIDMGHGRFDDQEVRSLTRAMLYAYSAYGAGKLPHFHVGKKHGERLHPQKG